MGRRQHIHGVPSSSISAYQALHDPGMARTALDITATAERPYVSKSKFLLGTQCAKLLWTAYNARDRIPEPDAAQQAIFDQGHEVGALAKALC